MNGLLEAREISCRVQQVDAKGVTLLLYVTSRAGQEKLDEKYGVLGWKDEYREIGGQLFCRISAWDCGSGQWIYKEDVGTESFTEKEKGRASDAFKRACVKHGIARELYSAPRIYIPSSQCSIVERKDKSGKGTGKYNTYDKFHVNKITYNAYKEINELEIANQDLTIVFKQYGAALIDDIKYKLLVYKMEEADVLAEDIINIIRGNTLKEMLVDEYVKVIKKLDKTIEVKRGK